MSSPFIEWRIQTKCVSPYMTYYVVGVIPLESGIQSITKRLYT